MSTKVLIIGLDGIDPCLIKHRLDTLPNLAYLIRGGTWGKLRSTIPPLSSPAWATAMSGMNPGKTGISGFVKSNFTTSTQELTDSRSVAVPRIWNVLSHHGKRVAVVGVPLTYPVEEINGVMIGGFLTPSQENIFTFPPELGQELLRVGYRLHVTQGEYEYREKKRFLEDIYQSSSVKFDTVLHLLGEEKWDCFIFVLSETDWIQHFFDREPEDPEHEANEQVILEYFQFVDNFLEQAVIAAGNDACMVLMSDHGFGRFLRANVHLNTWLMNKGYLVLQEKQSVKVRHWLGSRLRSLARLPGFRFLKKGIPRRMKAAALQLTSIEPSDIVWNRTKAYFYNVFASTGCVRINREAFVQDKDYEAFRRKLKEEMQSLEDPERHCKLIDEIYFREELYQGLYVEQEPDIVFLFAEAYGGQDTVAPSLVINIPEGGAPGPGHRLQGIYALWGQEIRAGQKFDASIEDIAPTVYHLLDVGVPAGTDGHVLNQAFAHASRTKSEIRYADYDIPRKFIKEPLTLGQEEQVLDRLRGLGYIE